MSVAPNHSDCVVTFLLYISRMNVLGHLINFKNLSSVDLVYTTSASTLYPELIRVNLLYDFPLVTEYDFTLYWIVPDLLVVGASSYTSLLTFSAICL